VIEEKDIPRFLELLERNQKNATNLSENLRQIFDLLDADKNGYLDRFVFLPSHLCFDIDLTFIYAFSQTGTRSRWRSPC
jgi:hypothetical protein